MAATLFLNGCVWTPTLGGTGTWTVSTAVSPYFTPAQCTNPAVVDSRTYQYFAVNGTEYEIGYGIYTVSGTTLTRATILSSSNGGSTVDFSVPPVVRMGVPLAQDGEQTWNRNRNNLIINGGMQISQENGTTAGTASGFYPVDQWYYNSSNTATVSLAQVTSVTANGSPNRIRATVTSTDTSIDTYDIATISQRIEGMRTAPAGFGAAGAKQIILIAGIKAPAGTYGVVLQNGLPGGGGNCRSYVSEVTVSGGEANTDKYVSFIIPGDTSGIWATDYTVGFYISFTLAAGSGYQTSLETWTGIEAYGTSSQSNFLGTVSNVFELFDVGLYVDYDEISVAPLWELPDFVSELAECQRYWEKSYDYGQAPGTGAATGGIVVMYMAGLPSAQYTVQTMVSFKVPKRTAPTMTAYAGASGTSGSFRDYNASVDVTATFAGIGHNEASVSVQTNGAATSFDIEGHWVANARV